jgi:hypothetical protein
MIRDFQMREATGSGVPAVTYRTFLTSGILIVIWFKDGGLYLVILRSAGNIDL